MSDPLPLLSRFSPLPQNIVVVDLHQLTLWITIFEALVRPILDYASSIWDPHTIASINKIEAVQRRAARWVVNRHRQTTSVNEMLDQLNWPPLSHRRRKARLTTFFKYHHGEVVVNTSKRPTPKPPVKSTRRSHTKAYQLPACRTTYRQQSFFPSTIVEWNALPSVAVTSATVEAFKTYI